MFFNVRSIIDLESADKIVRKAFDDYGVKFLTDSDLKMLQDRIGKTPNDSRINLGFVDFYGYNKDFFKYIKGNSHEAVITSISKLKTTLNKLLIDYIQSKIHELVLSKITEGLLNKGRVHSFSVGVSMPYLFKRLSMRLVSRSLPKDLLSKYYPQFKMEKNELIDEISETLFENSERVMKGDYSKFVGNPSDIEFKKRIFNHIHMGFNSIEDAKKVFKRDIQVLQPILDEIEGIITDLVPEEKTIIVKDCSFLGNKEELDKILETYKSIE